MTRNCRVHCIFMYATVDLLNLAFRMYTEYSTVVTNKQTPEVNNFIWSYFPFSQNYKKI